MNIVEGAVYRHAKRGTYYEMIGRAKMQVSDAKFTLTRSALFGKPLEEHWDFAPALEKITMVVYRSLSDDTLWVRPETEFCDGRFEPT